MLSHRNRAFFVLAMVLILLTGCGQTNPTATSVPATATQIASEATNTPLPPTITSAPATDTAVSEGTSAPSAPTTTPPSSTPSGSGGGTIAFVSDRDGNAEIYLMAVDGSGQRNITNSPFSEAGPAWSPAGAPGGQQIAFSSTRNDNTDIYVMAVPEGADPDGSNLRRLTEHPAVDAGPVWSPDGTKIAFVSLRDGDAEIYVVDADGSNLQRLTRNSYDDWEVDWSPDGTQIAVSSQVGEYANIYTINVKAALQGTAKRKQLTNTNAHDAFPKWSPAGAPGGERIAFISDRKGSGNWEVYVMDTDGSNRKRLTYSDSIDGLPTWSPDGTQIAFESNRDGDNEIYVVNVEEALHNPKGAEILRLTDNDANDQQPTWRPSDAAVDRSVTQLEDLPLDEFLRESFRQLQLRDPDSLFANGFADFYGAVPGDRFTDISTDYIHETQQLERDILDLLRTYDRSMLSADQKISYDSFEWYLTTQVRGHAFADYKFLINPVWGLQNWPIDLLLEHPLENKQDAENYIARLSSLDIWAEQVIEGLERNEQVGAIPPQYVLEDTIEQLDAILNIQETDPAPAEQFELYVEFSSKVRQIDDLGRDERDALLNSALAEIEGTLIPAYQVIKDHLIYLTTIAVEDPNQWKLPGGEDYYTYLLQYYTGTSLSADEIHALGLAEVARIQADIRDAAADLGYPADSSITELNQRMTEESQIVTGDALRRKYEQILTAADGAAEAYFDLRTSADVVIRPEPSGPPAYYESPAPGSPGPGVMPANLDISPLYANYNEHVLVHHETIPGHHTQIALALELDLPGYQRFSNVNPYLQNYAFQAYTEGWALYAEVLAWEMGLYEDDPFANLGRLRLRLLRTVRIVVDTGIHAKGWTLDEAAAYLEEVTGMPQSYARLTRYLVNPGYPCGYNIGGLKILEMRQRAMEKLGDRFDIKEFHNTVLGNGILPIGVLESVVDDWIEAKLDQKG